MSLKKIVCGILAFILIMPLALPVNSYASGNFSDTTGHWAEVYISKVFKEDVIDGYPNGRFYPDKAVTRAEFISMVNKAFKLDDLDNSESMDFTDVSYSNWYYDDVSTAIAAGYAGGYSDNTFRPNNPISRQEAAVMLSKLIPASKAKGSTKSFSDSKLIADWATDAMGKMNAKGYIGAYSDNKIHPSDPLTRAQSSKILSDILDNEDIVTGRVIVKKDGTTLADKIYVNGVLISSELEEGSAAIDNCIILGDLDVEGGSKITLNNTRVTNINVNKEDSTVQVLTKGTTVVPKLEASKSCSLQPSSKGEYGFQNVQVKKGADVSLKGNFPNVSIVGSYANLTLESGTITNLDVTSAGKYSDITLSGKAKITEATVNGESYFHGDGTISHMTVNADNVTYETKPLKMTVGLNSDRPEAEGNEEVEVTFDPASKETDVDVDTKITISFNTAMLKADGSGINDSDISNFVSLLLGSKSGTAVEFSAVINSAKKVITLTPAASLTSETKYYVVLKEDALENAGGYTNDGTSAYFTTGESDIGPNFSPSNGASGVALLPTVTIKFDESVVKYSDGSDVTASYLQECIQFKTGSASGSSVGFTASISSSKNITITPSANLTAGQTYYVAVVANKLKTENSETVIPASSVLWTVAGSSTTPALSGLKLTSADTSIKVDYTPNAAGTVYALATTSAITPTEAQIMAGKSATAAAGSAGTMTITGLTANTKYYVYVLLRNSSNVNSAIVSGNTTTTISDATLKGLTVSPSGGSNVLTGFSSATKSYNVVVPFGITSVDVSASADTALNNPVITINGTTAGTLSGIALTGYTNNVITVNVSADNKTTSKYIINVDVAGNTDLDSISINGTGLLTGSDTFAANVAAAATSATVSVTAEDNDATITIGSITGTGTCTADVSLGAGNQVITFTVKSNVDTKTYTIQFTRLI